MKNRILMLLSFLMAFAIATPALALSAEEPATSGAVDAKAVVTEDAKSTETKEEAPPAEAPKPAEIKTDSEAASATHELLDAARGGKWAAVASFLIMLLVFLVNRVPAIAAKLGPKAKPWLAAGTGIAGYIAAALLVDGTTILTAVSGGFMTGAGAVGLWEMIFKHVMKPAEPAST
jgi:hypothetical protein